MSNPIADAKLELEAILIEALQDYGNYREDHSLDTGGLMIEDCIANMKLGISVYIDAVATVAGFNSGISKHEPVQPTSSPKETP